MGSIFCHQKIAKKCNIKGFSIKDLFDKIGTLPCFAIGAQIPSPSPIFLIFQIDKKIYLLQMKIKEKSLNPLAVKGNNCGRNYFNGFANISCESKLYHEQRLYTNWLKNKYVFFLHYMIIWYLPILVKVHFCTKILFSCFDYVILNLLDLLFHHNWVINFLFTILV